MKYIYIFSIVFFLIHNSEAQKWVDTVYKIQTYKNISYGTAIDFAGNSRDLTLDVSIPQYDTVPKCGRPLIIMIHGGSFLSGSKDDFSQNRMMVDFAKRGYVAASVNYRLGWFQTNSNWHCNISYFGVPWDCLNAQDSIEFYRALYRGMQDVKGSIRFLINNKSYEIDPNNVFLIGESAGGFIALSTAFMDHSSEKDTIYGKQSTMLPPYINLENQCIQTYNLDTSIASMNLIRPDLGSINGELNPVSKPYKIKGVGNFYGGIVRDIFKNYTYNEAPVLYMFHQPNDLIVPYKFDYVYAGLANCAVNNAGCAYIINRPHVSGSSAINQLIDNYRNKGLNMPKLLFDSTNNYSDCISQVLDPNKGGHSIDNYSLRTNNIAKFFAKEIDTADCLSLNSSNLEFENIYRIFPNPSDKYIYIQSKSFSNFQLSIIDMTGKTVLNTICENENNRIDISMLSNGVYQINIYDGEYIFSKKFVKID